MCIWFFFFLFISLHRCIIAAWAFGLRTEKYSIYQIKSKIISTISGACLTVILPCVSSSLTDNFKRKEEITMKECYLFLEYIVFLFFFFIYLLISFFFILLFVKKEMGKKKTSNK